MSTTMKRHGTTKPRIVIREEDHEKLTQLANGLLDSRPDMADGLLDELERARVARGKAVPADTVQMGSTVEFGSDSSPARRVTLVYPRDADIAEGRISVLTPIGTALLGLAVGQSIDFTSNDGQSHRLTVLAVEPADA